MHSLHGQGLYEWASARIFADLQPAGARQQVADALVVDLQVGASHTESALTPVLLKGTVAGGFSGQNAMHMIRRLRNSVANYREVGANGMLLSE